jgi:Ca-activated chloride channel homolog
MKRISVEHTPLTLGGNSTNVHLSSGSFRKSVLLILVCLFYLSSISAININFAKSWRNLKGKQQYEKKNYNESGKTFNKNAVHYPDDGRLQYNMGNANYKLGKVDEALTSYQKSLSDKNYKEQSKTHQNMGNIHYNKKEFQEALDNYKKAVIESPNNQDARYNYEMAKKALVQQKQQKQEQQKQDKNKEQKKEEKKEQKSAPQDQEDQKKKDADQLLKALMENERNDMKKQQQPPTQRPKNAKYW